MRWHKIATAMTGLVMLAACAQVPSSGPIVEVDQQVAEPAFDTVVRSLARPPAPGMSQEEVVQGFLDASSSFTNDHQIARLYLTAAAARTWNADSRARVYANDTERLQAAGPQGVRFSAILTGLVSREKQYVPEEPGTTIDERFELAQINGQWRIAELPSGLLLSRAAAERSYRKFQTYFVAKPGGILSPNSILFAAELRDVTEEAIEALLAGPSSWLRPAVSTGFPAGTRLLRVVVDSGVARVDLSAEAGGAGDLARQQLSAQLVWTLRQVPGVRAIAITVDGEPLAVPEAPVVQPITSWDEYDPDGLPRDSPWFLQRQGEVLRVGGTGVPVGVDGPAGQGDPPVSDPVIGLDTSRVAATGEGRVLISRMDARARWEPTDVRLSTKGGSWDRFGRLWLSAGEDGVRTLTEGVERKVEVPRTPVTSVQISRDGTRALVIAGPADRAVAYVMIVERDGDVVRLVRPRIIVTDPVRAGAWASATQVALLVRSPGEPPQVAQVELGFYTVRLLPGPPRARTVAAAPNRLLLSGSADGRIWGFNGTTWIPQTLGQQPRYPG